MSQTIVPLQELWQDDITLVWTAVAVVLAGDGFSFSINSDFAYKCVRNYLTVKAIAFVVAMLIRRYFAWRKASAPFRNKPLPEIKGLEFIKGDPLELSGAAMATKPKKALVLVAWSTKERETLRANIYAGNFVKNYTQKFEKNLDVVWITNEAKEVATVKSFVKETGTDLVQRVAVDVEQNAQKLLFDQTGADSLPYAVIVSSEGVCVWGGHPYEDEFKEVIEKECLEVKDQ